MREADGLRIDGTVLVRYCGKAKELVIPEGVEAIASDAFSGCLSLAKIIVPATVKRIGHRAFRGCIGLRTIYFAFTEKIDIGWSVFFQCANPIKVVFAGDAETFRKNFGPRYDPPEYDTMYGERCAGTWHYPLGHPAAEAFVCEAYCEADCVTVRMQGEKVDFLGTMKL